MTLAELYRKEGEKTGLQKGMEKGKFQIAWKLINKGFSNEDIDAITELSIQKIERLRKETFK